MNWHDEIPRLFRHPLDELAMAFFVREKMKNDWEATREDLRLTFGQDWERIVRNLCEDGILRREDADGVIRLRVVAPGDKKREKCRILGKNKREKTNCTQKNAKIYTDNHVEPQERVYIHGEPRGEEITSKNN